jgi:hypothetical protein
MSTSTSEPIISDDEKFKQHFTAELALLKAEINALHEQLAGLKAAVNPAIVTIETPAGLSVTLDDTSQTITLKDNAQNSVILEQNGISLKSNGNISLTTSGNINLNASSIALQASSQISATSAASVSLNSSSELSIRSAMVTIN